MKLTEKKQIEKRAEALDRILIALKELSKANQRNAATAKLREENRLLQGQVNQLTILAEELETKHRQLAHQQPSAPTPDVEKIADDTLRAYPNAIGDGAFKQQLLSLIIDGIVRYDAQARAPLVADKERLDWLTRNCFVNREGDREIRYDFPGKVDLREAIDAARAAVIGTGEK